MEYLSHLNQNQRDAASYIDGPLMVIAGAGSGKTRVLTYRVAHLIKQGVDPFNILALTFTNKAAKEMKERITKIIGSNEGQNIWMGTFHSIFARILRTEHEKIGYPRNFTIYDTQDSRNLVKTIVKEMNLDDKIYKPAGVLSRISSAKSNLISAQAYLKNAEIASDDRMSNRPKIGEIYLTYQKRCFKAGAMDFDDLLFKTNVLLKDHPDVLLSYQHKFKHILVDEYQDTNFSQYLIVKKLAATHENLCVVGDDAQSIYAFRGANIQNILNFKRDYPDYKLFKLEQNYRSTKVIVNAANSIIAKNQDQIKKNVWTSNAEGNRIKVIKALTDNEEGNVIAQNIFSTIQNEQARNDEFAILYRTNAQSRSFEEALRKRNVPYKIYGGLSFYQRKEVKDLLAYFRLTANHNDEEALKRIINFPKRGIGKTSIDKAIVVANEAGVTLWDVITTPENYALALNTGTRNKLGEFTTMIKSFATKLTSAPAYELAHEIASSCGILKEFYADKTPEGISKYENLQELLNGIKEFSEPKNDDDQIIPLGDFLIDVALLTDADNENPEEKNKVTLMTIHASKGLEFPYVYIVGLEENLFPSQMSLNTRSELEEERRLFYVALTRAEKTAVLSYATSRYRWGNLITCEPSRFIEEIDPSFLDVETAGPSSKSTRKQEVFGFGKSSASANQSTKVAPAPKPSNLKKVTSSIGTTTISDVAVGNNVSHERFGKGKVINIEGDLPNQKATVFFPSVGQKQLLLKFAKLVVLD